MKKLFIILIIAFFGIMAIAVYFSQNASRHQEDLTQERYLRMVAEANFEKASGRINSLEDQIAALKSKTKNAEKLLEQTSTANTDLKTKLEQTSQLKEELEDKIKELEKGTLENASSSALPDDGSGKI